MRWDDLKIVPKEHLHVFDSALGKQTVLDHSAGYPRGGKLLRTRLWCECGEMRTFEREGQ
jgi:hypothetical protein